MAMKNHSLADHLQYHILLLETHMFDATSFSLFKYLWATQQMLEAQTMAWH